MGPRTAEGGFILPWREHRKRGARAADPKSRAMETDASGLNRRLLGARGSSRSFVGVLPFRSLRSLGHEKVGWTGAAAYKRKRPRLD
jgi:hypothetical protein